MMRATKLCVLSSLPDSVTAAAAARMAEDLAPRDCS